MELVSARAMRRTSARAEIASHHPVATNATTCRWCATTSDGRRHVSGDARSVATSPDGHRYPAGAWDQPVDSTL